MSTNPETSPVNPDLFLAATTNDVALLEKALSDGADINQIDPVSKATPLHIAAYWGSLDFIRRAAEEPNLNPQVYDADGYTPFLHAANRGDTEIKQILYGLISKDSPTPEPL